MQQKQYFKESIKGFIESHSSKHVVAWGCLGKWNKLCTQILLLHSCI